MLSFAIVEDEDQEAGRLLSFINEYCDAQNIKVNIVRFCCATELLKNYKPIYNIIFMDIMLPNLNGMEAAKRLRVLDSEVVLMFVTNMANFAVKGYEVDALDFIVKPIVYDSFVMKMKKAIKVTKESESVSIQIQMDGSLKIISISKICYIEVIRHNIIYHTEDGIFNGHGTLAAIEKRLAGKNFSRCNVCFLINLKFVTGVNGDNLIIGNDTLKISRARKKEFMQSLTNYLGKSV